MASGLLESGIIKHAGAYTPGWTSNMRLTVASSGLKIVGYDGNDLTAANPGWATVYSTTHGNVVPLKFEASPAITGANIQGRLGTTASVAWGSSMPLYFGIANVDDTAANADFYLSRNPKPCWIQATTNNIGKAGAAAAASAQDNIIIWDAAATVADYNSVPLTCLGSCTGTIDASAGGVTTIDALGINDGFGKFQEGVQFTFPEGQNGATAGSYFSEASAATTLDFAGMTYSYWQHRDGRQTIYFNTGARSAADASAVILWIHTPASASFVCNVGIPLVRRATDIDYFAAEMGAGSYFRLRGNIGDASGTLTVADFSDAGDYIINTLATYQAF